MPNFESNFESNFSLKDPLMNASKRNLQKKKSIVYDNEEYETGTEMTEIEVYNEKRAKIGKPDICNCTGIVLTESVTLDPFYDYIIIDSHKTLTITLPSIKLDDVRLNYPHKTKVIHISVTDNCQSYHWIKIEDDNTFINKEKHHKIHAMESVSLILLRNIWYPVL
jgi:hypothetical protein